MSEKTDVYEIDVTKKYILQFKERLRQEDLLRMIRDISDWVASDAPFLILEGDVKLVRVEDADIPPEEGV
jgi:hypothetical protein